MTLEAMITLVTGLGAGGGPVFFVLWFMERKERMKCQEKVETLQIQQINTNNVITNALIKVTDSLAEFRIWSKEANNAVVQAINAVKGTNP